MTRSECCAMVAVLAMKAKIPTPKIRWASNTKAGRFFPCGHRGRSVGMISLGPNVWRGGSPYHDFEGLVLHEFTHHLVREETLNGQGGPRKGSHGPQFCKALVRVLRWWYGEGGEWMYGWHLDYPCVYRYGRMHGWVSVTTSRALRDQYLQQHAEWLARRAIQREVLKTAAGKRLTP